MTTMTFSTLKKFKFSIKEIPNINLLNKNECNESLLITRFTKSNNGQVCFVPLNFL